MKNIWAYVSIAIVLVLLVLIIITIPKQQTQDVNYTIKLADYNDVVTVDYMLTVDGNVIDSSFDKNNPLTFEIGSGQTIKGFEKAIVGMYVGQDKTFVVKPEDGYGKADVYPNEFDQPLNQIIQYISQNTNKGYDVNEYNSLIGTKLYGASVTCVFYKFDSKANVAYLKCQHFLAGKDLTFRVKLLKIDSPIINIDTNSLDSNKLIDMNNN